MSSHLFRNAVWTAIIVATATLWTFAFIGARSLVAEPACISIWSAAKTSLPVNR